MRLTLLCVLGVGLLLGGCGSDDSGGGSGGSSGAGGSGGSGTVVVACNTGTGPTKGCSEIPIPAAAEQNFRDDCTNAGSVVSDTCPTTGANAKCIPAPGSAGLITPNVIYWYGLMDQADFDKAMQNCQAMNGTFEQL